MSDLAKEVGDDWAQSAYYDQAEKRFAIQWRDDIWPLIRDCDFTCTVELAAGRGRNSARLQQLASKLYLVDINPENVDALYERFRSVSNVVLIKNDGLRLTGIADCEATFVYSFDSMVHFDSDVLRQYLREFSRVLRRGGTGFCHYSNYSGDPTGSYRNHPAWRNFMSIPLFEHYAAKEGLQPVRSLPLMWRPEPESAPEPLDGLTLFRKV